MTLSDHLRYSQAARPVLLHTLQTHRQHFTRPFETTGEFNTIRLQLAHIIAAEERWIFQRIQGKPVNDFENRAADTIEGIWEQWEPIRAETVRVVESQTPASLEKQLHVSMRNGSRTLTMEQILFHIFNHEVHHRAQISLLIQQFGGDPPNFDSVLFFGTER
jgi:uncharacterized damage-inducible protein DinB